MKSKSGCNWFKREVWFTDLKRSDVVCGVAGSGGKINQLLFVGWVAGSGTTSSSSVKQWLFLAWQSILTGFKHFFVIVKCNKDFCSILVRHVGVSTMVA